MSDNIYGLYVGQLNDEELELLDLLVKQGKARVIYKGASGFLGLGKVEHATDPYDPVATMGISRGLKRRWRSF